jgi:FkbM family methyltransferase
VNVVATSKVFRPLASAAIKGLASVGNLFPSSQHVWHDLEVLFAMLQGKGYGLDTVKDEVLAALSHIDGDGLTILDVGANKGVWTGTLLRLGSKRVDRIYAFEPSSANIPFLKQIRDPRVTVVPMAIGDRCGQMDLFCDWPGSTLASVYKRKLDHFGIDMAISETVDVTTVDAFMAERGLKQVDFMKIDVEGHEFSVLRGALRMLRSRRIRALSFEFGGCAIDARVYFRDFWYMLRDLDFDLYRIAPRGATVALPQYREVDEAFRTTNYLAVLRPGADASRT